MVILLQLTGTYATKCVVMVVGKYAITHIGKRTAVCVEVLMIRDLEMVRIDLVHGMLLTGYFMKL